MKNEERILIKTLWNNGSTIDEISKLLPYSKQDSVAMIRSLLDDGTISKDGQIKLTQKILNAYEIYKNPYDIAEKLCVPIGTVKTTLCIHKKKWVRAKKNRNKRKPTDIATLSDKTKTIIDELKTGKKKAQIAEECGVARQYVYTVYNKFVREQ